MKRSKRKTLSDKFPLTLYPTIKYCDPPLEYEYYCLGIWHFNLRFVCKNVISQEWDSKQPVQMVSVPLNPASDTPRLF